LQWQFKDLPKMVLQNNFEKAKDFFDFFWNCSIILGKKREKSVLFQDNQKSLENMNYLL